MITKPTALILGAGTSCPYGFPAGLQLKARICKALNVHLPSDYQPTHTKREMGIDNDFKEVFPYTYVQDFSRNLVSSPDASIDAFLEHHPEYKEIGHRAIASILLAYETHASLFDDWVLKWDDPNNNEKHWYQLLFSNLNSTFDGFSKNQLSIITFNYDRSLEYFLLHSIGAKYKDVDKAQAGEKLRTIPIVHLYGKLGALEHYDKDGIFVPYGDGKIFRASITNASNSINTINDEYAADQPAFVEARKLIKAAERIYFLGFGYHEENMKRLFTDHTSSEAYNILKEKGQFCFGTTKGISPHHRRKLEKIGLKKMSGNHKANPSGHRFPEMTVYDFLFYNDHSALD